MSIHPLTKTDTQLLSIVQWYKIGLVSENEMKRAIKKLRDEAIIKENVYQGRSL